MGRYLNRLIITPLFIIIPNNGYLQIVCAYVEMNEYVCRELKQGKMKGVVFVNSIRERHSIVRVSKSGIKITATNLADNEDYVFYLDVPTSKYIKAYTKDVELGTREAQ